MRFGIIEAVKGAVRRNGSRCRRLIPALLAGIALCGLANEAGAQRFAPAVTYDPGGYSRLYDVNGDGKPDIVSANASAKVVSVALNNGDGSFAAPTNYPVAIALLVIVLDLNGDGKPDIVNYGYDTGGANVVSVLINNGAGTFKPGVEYVFSGNPYFFDLNGDGKPDIIAVTGGSVSVALNNGDGSFPAKTSYPVFLTSSQFLVEDLNGDGKPDIISYGDSASSVLINNGNGAFKPRVDYTFSGTLQLYDLNGDGKPDVVSTNSGVNTVSVSLNNGNGTFGAKTSYRVTNPPAKALVSDLNGDGKPDILSSDFLGTSSVLINKGSGAFNSRVDYTFGAAPQLYDLNGDGRPDIIASNVGVAAVNVTLNNGDGTFAARTVYPITNSAASVQVVDLNGDGRPDILSSNGVEQPTSVLINNGNGAFKPSVDYAFGGLPVLNDLNGDGKPDVISDNYNANTLSVSSNNGDGTFSPRTDYPVTPAPGYFKVMDLNGDGALDIIVVGTTSKKISVLINTTGSPVTMARRLIWENALNNSVVYWQLNKTTHTTTGFLSQGVPADWRVVAYADITGNGSPALIWQNQLNNSVVYWQFNGTAYNGVNGFLSTGIPLEWKIVAVADVTGDGKPDLIWENTLNNSVVYWEMNGTTHVSTGFLSQGLPLDWKVVAVADVTGDGKNDLIWQNSLSNAVVYWQMNGTQRVTSGFISRGIADGIPLDWKVVAAADVTGDGKTDLIWQNKINNSVVYWQMNNTTEISNGFLSTGIPLEWKIVGLQ